MKPKTNSAPEFPKPLPNRIREWRRLRNVTLEWVEERTDISRAEMSKLEVGQRPLKADHLIKIGAALNVAPRDLVNAKDADKLLGQFADVLGKPASGPAIPDVDAVPVRGKIVGGKLTELDQTVGQITLRLPSGLASGGLFAVYNPSALGAIKLNDMLVLTTVIPPAHGDLILARRKDGSGEVRVFDRSRGDETVLKVCAIIPR